MREKIIETTFRQVDAHLRKASLAQVGGFRPSEDPLTSWFGGRFVGLSDEDWPSNENGPMLPLLQVITRELPYIPPALEKFAAFVIFVDCEHLPVNTPASAGNGWLIRTYQTMDQLRPLQHSSFLKPFPIKWSLSETEAPCWEDAWSICNLDEFNDLPDCINLFYDRYSSYGYTKIGGWPAFIQGAPPYLKSNEFLIQIGTEEKSQWGRGDAGSAYIYLSDGIWLLHWDCY